MKSEFIPQESGSGCVAPHWIGASQDENVFGSQDTGDGPVLEAELVPELLASVVAEPVLPLLASDSVEEPAVLEASVVDVEVLVASPED